MIPEKLRKGDEIRVVAPACSMAMISIDLQKLASARFNEMGLKVSFGQHAHESDAFGSSTIESRIDDLHAAFSDPKIKAIVTIIGGFNSNQLLKYLDYDLIRQHPKIFCGYSDITALQNAIYAKTGLVTYSGPHFSSFAMKLGFDFTKQYFQQCLFENKSFELKPSENWSDDRWYLDQDQREFIKNPGYTVLSEGIDEGTIVGGNLCTLNLLQGTPFMPSLQDSVLFLEDDAIMGSQTAVEVDRNLQSLIHLPEFGGVRGIVFGRFQKKSEMTEEKLANIIASKKELAGMPIISEVDFGHTTPILTYPIGGRVRLRADSNGAKIEIIEH